jgi:uncharacterized protein
MEYYLLTLGFFIIALIYASVGFGGGTSYLAFLSLPFFALPFTMIKATALMCNIVVVSGGAYIFYKEGKLDLKKDWPYLVASVPLAYLGGQWPLQENDFFKILGFVLLTASLLLWVEPGDTKERTQHEKIWLQIPLASGLGFLSGLTSIGGGIFLSPVLHFLRWKEAKKISALASVYILVNSVSGLLGQLSRGFPRMNWSLVAVLLLAVIVGGQIGSRLGARKFNPLYIKRITAVLIFVAAVNILKDHW